jgi:ankyrin repeat protein
MAAMGGHLELVQLLLANGSEVNSRDADGATPWSRAKEKNQEDVVRVLQDHGGAK